LKPKPDAPVTYGKLKLLVKKKGSIPVKMDFYDERLQLIRTLHYSEVKKFRGHKMPSVWRMENVQEKGRETIFKIEDARFNKKIKSSVFTHENLENQD
jgi:outer membrane lipoprotein-sorting protein